MYRRQKIVALLPILYRLQADLDQSKSKYLIPIKIQAPLIKGKIKGSKFAQY